ncbi:MAG: thioredoxin domain-containing protein [Actinomycetes bacterium]
MTNRLADSTSPYLLQHRDNPVDWWPWCDEAFDEARRRDVPVFLSVGYAACHWCHVMAHESFEDDATAGVLNDGFVAIKVDREERPDVDAVYMAALQGLTGQGGWPMSVFLDHERRPFHAGTYYPRYARGRGATFIDVLDAVSRTWMLRREDITRAAAGVREALAEHAYRSAAVAAAVSVDSDVTLAERLREATEVATDVLADLFDHANGGFSNAPKFPPSTVLEFLLRRSARHDDPRLLTMVSITCLAMARGGMYDQLAGGFARYSVDESWTVPHFEKMLPDNALLLRAYTHWYRATGEPFAKRIARQTAEFLLADLLTDQGMFASSLDADAPARLGGTVWEGQSYCWTPDQLRGALGDADGTLAAKLLGVTGAGTFEHGTSVLQLRQDPASVGPLPGGQDPDLWWGQVRSVLRRERDSRPQPARDDKVIVAWNGLTIGSLAEAGALLDEPDWVRAAERAAEAVTRIHLVTAQGRTRLFRASADGMANTSAAGVLADYADLAAGLLTLAGVTGEQRWREIAGDLLDTVLEQFARPGGGFFDTAADAEQLIVRPGDPADLAEPSGWSAAADALLSYGTLMTSDRHLRAAEAALDMADVLGRSSPQVAGAMLATAQAYLDGPREVVIVGDGADPARRDLHRAALRSTAPGLVIAVGEAEPGGSARRTQIGAELDPFADRPAVDEKATGYVCQGTFCHPPVTDVQSLEAQLA